MTSAIRAALKKRYQDPEWALLFEVPSGLGRDYKRSADALAMNLFESRGFRIEGVEIKISRGDWLRELRDPEKSQLVQRYCDHWWIATPPDIVLDGELPPTWGLLELRGGCMRVKAKAPKLDPIPLNANFVAGMVRRANQKADAELSARVQEATQEARTKVADEVERRVKDRTREVERLRAQVSSIEAVCGPVSEWEDAEAIAQAIQVVRKSHLFGGWDGLSSLSRKLAQVKLSIDEIVSASVGRNAERQDAEERLGPKDEHAVPKADAQ